MAIRLPFTYQMRYLSPYKIGSIVESNFIVDLQDTVNNLIARCNSLNSTTIRPITGMVNPVTKAAPLTLAEFDSNLTKFITKANAIIVGSGSQGLNPDNLVSLILRGSKTNGLSIYERDCNCFTICTFINTIDKLYKQHGV